MSMIRKPDDVPSPQPHCNVNDGLNAADVVASLSAYDDSLREGGGPETPGKNSRAQFGQGPPIGLVDCLHLLERIWPRTGADSTAANLPQQIGRFEIERVLGHGGFGIVYLATDPVLNRQVALKVPRLHSLADNELRERFRREARAAATLDHPNIVPIYETGHDGPIEYIASAYCRGPNLATWLGQQTMPVACRLAALVVVQLADAAQHSHAHGVLHRDLKPGNVMLVPVPPEVSPADEQELPFIPRLTDFGLALLLEDRPGETAASAMLGTPAYMAPEQVGGSTEGVGPRTDIYSLGVLLYEMLTGCQPFQGSGVADVLDQIRNREPLPLRRLRRDIPRDLETICLKCLEKTPRQRFASARELAAELHRFLRGEPLLTKPPGPLRRAAKWVKRRRLATALIATITMAAIIVPTILIIHNRRLEGVSQDLRTSLTTATHWRAQADTLRERAELAAADAQQRRRDAEIARVETETQRQTAADMAYSSAMRLAELAWRESDVRQCRAFLNVAAQQRRPEGLPALEWKFVDAQIRADFQEVGEPSRECTCVAVSPDGNSLATGGTDGRVQLIVIGSGVVERVLQTSHGVVRSVIYSRSGDQVATCGDDRSICVWNTLTGERLFTSPVTPGELQSIVWLHDDEWIAAAGGKGFPGVFLWKVTAQTETSVLDTGSENVTSLASSSDGLRVAAGGHDGTVWIWDSVSQQLLSSRRPANSKLTALTFSRDGHLLAIGGNDQRVRLCRVDGQDLQPDAVLVLRDDIRSLAFLPDDNRLAVLEQFGTVHLTGVSTEPVAEAASDPPGLVTKLHILKSWQAHERRGWQLGLLSNASQLVSVGGDGPARLWDIDSIGDSPLLPSPPVKKGYEFPLLFAADSRHLFTSESGVRSWSVRSRQIEASSSGEEIAYQSLALSADGRFLAAGSDTSHVMHLWDLRSGLTEPVATIPVPHVDFIAFSPLNNTLAIADWQNDSVLVFDLSRHEQLRSMAARQCHEVAYSPDGAYLAVDVQDDIVIWKTDTWTVAARLKGHLSTILTLAFSPDGRWLASGGRDREIRLWRTEDWQFVRGMHGHRSEVQVLRFTADGRSLLALGGDDYLKVWHPDTGLEVCNLRIPNEGRSSNFALSPDMRQLAIRLRDGRVQLQELWSDTQAVP